MRTAVGHSADAYESPMALRIVMVCAMAGMFMQTLDQTIANVALPHMQGSLAASRDQITWVLTSYIVAAAIMTAPIGWLASRFGKRMLGVVSIAGFTVASALCGAAQSLEQMIVFRILQGVFGAALGPLSQAIMLDLYPPQKRGTIMALWGMGVMLGPILGPTLGGVLTDSYSWRWVFYINVPFGIAASIGLFVFFKDSPKDSTMRFDWFGFGLLALALGALQLMLDRGTDKDWFSSPEIIVEAVIAGLGLYLFAVHMLTAKNPFIPRQVFKDRSFVSSMTMMFVLGAMLVASSALIAPYLQNLGGYTVTEAGLLMVPRGLGTMAAMMFSGRVAMKMDARIVMGAGAAVLVWSMWEMAQWTPAVSEWTLTWVGFVQGAGMGFIFPPMQLVAFSTLPQHLRTDGTAVMNLLRNIGAAIGISITTTVLTSSVQINHAQIASHVTPFNRALGMNAPSMMWNPQLPFGLQQINGVIEWNAQVIAYANVFLLMFFMCVPALLIIALMRKPVLVPPSGRVQAVPDGSAG